MHVKVLCGIELHGGLTCQNDLEILIIIIKFTEACDVCSGGIISSSWLLIKTVYVVYTQL